MRRFSCFLAVTVFLSVMASASSKPLPIEVEVLKAESYTFESPPIIPNDCNWEDLSAYCYGSKPIDQLNELEYIKGEIYANIWHEDRIARISPQNGHVIGWIDLTGLLPTDQKINEESVLNGIAYDAQHDRLFVTGKQWPTIFEIKILNPASAKSAAE